MLDVVVRGGVARVGEAIMMMTEHPWALSIHAISFESSSSWVCWFCLVLYFRVDFMTPKKFL